MLAIKCEYNLEFFVCCGAARDCGYDTEPVAGKILLLCILQHNDAPTELGDVATNRRPCDAEERGGVE